MRVFLSHTGELARFPEGKGNSYVDIAMEAVRKAGHEPVDMGYFPDRHVEPSDVDRDELASCDVYIGIFGLR